MAQGKRPLTDEQVERFKREWARGTLLKVIAEELDVSVDYLRRLRFTLGLPQRNELGEQSVEVGCFLKPDLHGKVRIRARQNGKTISAYLRMLVLRDLGSAI